MKNLNKLLTPIFLSMAISLTACNKVDADIETNTQEPVQSTADVSEVTDLSSELQELIDFNLIPAMATVVIQGGEIVAEGVAGVRKYGDITPVTIDDQFILGSCGKAFTATLIAILVEQGKLDWNTTLAEYFPEMADRMLPRYRDVTLLHLLSHHAGLPVEKEIPIHYEEYSTPPVIEQRYEYTEYHLCIPPGPGIDELPEPGTSFLYSNVGYVIAGSIAEQATGESWEGLVTSLIFEPLGMTTARFCYNQGKGDNGGQPWQHTIDDSDPLTPVPIEYSYEMFPMVVGPAGMIQMSVRDWAKFVIMHTEGEDGGSDLLKPETFKFLHTPPFGTNNTLGTVYALGWYSINDPAVSTEPIYHHAGIAHGCNYAVVWMSAESNCAALSTINTVSDGALVTVRGYSAGLFKKALKGDIFQ